MKKLSKACAAIAVLLSDAMFAVVAYSYRDLLCSEQHLGGSAPSETAFYLAIPYAIGIAIFAAAALYFNKKSK